MIVAISQRHKADHEGTDALESKYIDYFSSLGVTLVPIPNQAKYVRAYFEALPIEGIILSGGGDIQPALYGGDPATPGKFSPERDEAEELLLTIAKEQDIPVLGICRGMEFINVYFGGKIQPIANVADGLIHDETRHMVTLTDNTLIQTVASNVEVNSYHRMVIGEGQLAANLTAFAVAPDRTVEGFYHPKLAIAAIVWHPERETAPSTVNETLVDAFLSRKLFWKNRKDI